MFRYIKPIAMLCAASLALAGCSEGGEYAYPELDMYVSQTISAEDMDAPITSSTLLGRIDTHEQFKSAVQMRPEALSPMLAYFVGMERRAPDTFEAHKESIPYFQYACDEGIGRGCMAAGFNMHFMVDYKYVPDEAFVLFERGCDMGNVFSCERYGSALISGTDKRRSDKKLANEVYRANCQKSSMESCANWLILNDLKVGLDEQRLSRLVSDIGESCTNERTGTCAKYASISRMRKDNTEAIRGFRNSCEKGSAVSCYNLGHIYMYAKDEHHDTDKAMAYFEEACRGRIPIACYSMALAHYNYPKHRDYERAAQISEGLCMQLNYASACGLMSDVHNLDKSVFADADVSLAIEGAKMACMGGKYHRCRSYARSLEIHVPGDQGRAEAQEVFNFACTNGDKPSCDELKRLSKGPDMLTFVSKGKTYSCDLSHISSCLDLASEALGGPGKGAPNYEVHQTVSEAICDAGDGHTCYMIGTVRKNGWNGYKKDVLAAKSYFEKSCGLGNRLGCQALDKS